MIYVDPSGHHYGTDINNPGGKADFGGETVNGNSIENSGGEGDYGPFGGTGKNYKEEYKFDFNNLGNRHTVTIKTTIYEDNGKVREISEVRNYRRDEDDWDYADNNIFGLERLADRLMQTERSLSEGEKRAVSGLTLGVLEILGGKFFGERKLVGTGVVTAIDSAIIGVVEFGFDRGIGNYPGINGAFYDAFGSAFDSISDQINDERD